MHWNELDRRHSEAGSSQLFSQSVPTRVCATRSRSLRLCAPACMPALVAAMPGACTVCGMSRTDVRCATPTGLMALAVIACVSSGSACASEDECEFEAVTRAIGGVGLMDCGIASVDDTDAVDDCAVSAYQSEQ